VVNKTLPCGQKRIKAAHATYNSRAGKIESGWRIDGDSCVYHFVIPMGATAKVSLISSGDELLVNERNIPCARDGERLTLMLKGGRYTVTVKN
jgi:hypothetical protein